MPRSSPERLLLSTTIDTPTLVVDEFILRSNLEAIANLARDAGVELYPHAKTHRTVQYGVMQADTGARGLTVATVGEAEAFARAGVANIVLAFPIVGEAKLQRLFDLSRQARLTLVADSITVARGIGEFFARYGARVDLLLDVDTGMGRTGVSPTESVTVARGLVAIDGLRFRGILTHEGSVYGARTPQEVRDRSRCVATTMASAARAIRRQGIPVDVVSVGSSASIRAVVGEDGVTQVRPGIYAFNDLGQIALGNATPANCAARVVATIVSSPAPDRAYIDAGSKSLSADPVPGAGAARYPGYGWLCDLPGWSIVRLSEEHGWLQWSLPGPPTPLEIGSQVQIIPNHICTVFSSMGESTLLRSGIPEATISTIPRSSH